jgi:hypothetical protein
LTARARPGRLGATTQRIVSLVIEEPPRAEDRPILRASPRNRLVWLAQFAEQAREPREARFRKIFAALVVVVTATAAGVAVKRAIDYHPRYVERIRAQQSESAGTAVTPEPEPATPPQPGGPPPHGGQTQANQE